MAGGDDSILIKIAVFGVTFSLISTVGIAVLFSGYNSAYSYDEIIDYRSDLVDFSGEMMLNQTPWILTGVFTPWNASLPVEGHIDDDGWLYGEQITDYSSLGKSADIRLDPNNKSSIPITMSDRTYFYEIPSGFEWWVDAGGLMPQLMPITLGFADLIGADPVKYGSATATMWNYTGYRYVFDPTLPFSEGASSREGSLSIVWYNYAGQEGLSGALQIYGGDILLASYAATDIISAYSASSGYASVYEFDFQGVKLNLSIRFDQNVIDSGMPLMQAFVSGNWSMAISSLSAGNFFDVENSAAFDMTAGSVIDTFVSIYTFDMPNTSSPWADMIMWLLVGLPMTLALACVALRLISSLRLLGGL